MGAEHRDKRAKISKNVYVHKCRSLYIDEAKSSGGAIAYTHSAHVRDDNIFIGASGLSTMCLKKIQK